MHGMRLRPKGAKAMGVILPLLLAAVRSSIVPRRPSLLICTPTAGSEPFPVEWISPGFLRSLRAGTFEGGAPLQVDYTEMGLGELNRTRIWKYSALLLFASPAGTLARQRPQDPPVTPDAAAQFPALLQDYVRSGGGVLLMPSSDNWRQQPLYDLTTAFGARLPVERIVETGRRYQGTMSRFSRPIAFTANVLLDHPLTTGVAQAWYPVAPHYNGADTTPLCLTPAGEECAEDPDNHSSTKGNWTVLLRASDSAVTQPVNLLEANFTPVPPSPYNWSRTKPVRSPALFAVRTLGAGRVALFSSWRQYTTGSGQLWLFDSQILSKGADGRPSHLGKLLSNTLEWLSTAPAGENSPGGFINPKGGLLPNEEPATLAMFEAPGPFNYSRPALSANPANHTLLTIKGLVGARTSLTTGNSSVADYAAAARKAGLGFVVFLEDWPLSSVSYNASNATLNQLKRECNKHSDKDLLLIPGYTIMNNIGNRMMMFGPGVPIPPKTALTPDGLQFQLMVPSSPGSNNYTGDANTVSFHWMLDAAHSVSRCTANCDNVGWNLGYYGLSDASASRTSMRMYDLRAFSAVGVVYCKRPANQIHYVARVHDLFFQLSY